LIIRLLKFLKCGANVKHINVVSKAVIQLLTVGWVIVEFLKNYCNKGEEAPIYYWRDQHGHEVDMVIDEGDYLELIKIKSSQTVQNEFFKNINWLNKLQNKDSGTCVYAGQQINSFGKRRFLPWDKLNKFTETDIHTAKR